MKLSQEFFKRLKEELSLNVPEDAYMVVTRVGRHQRAAGGWTSVIRSKSSLLFEVELYSPISELIKCPKLEVGDSYGTYVDCGCIGKCKGGK